MCAIYPTHLLLDIYNHCKNNLQRSHLYFPHYVTVSPYYKNSRVNSVTGRGGPYGCEASRLPCFIDNGLTYGGEVSLMRRTAVLYPKKDSWYSFLLEAESTPGPQCGWKSRSTEKSNDLIGNRTRDLRTCRRLPRPTTLRRTSP
jgi:hypothetical protein